MSNSNVAWIPHTSNTVPAATVAVTSSASGYPISNIKALPISATWRSTDTTDQAITIDFGFAQTIDVVALINHNFRNYTLLIEAGSTTSYGGFSTYMGQGDSRILFETTAFINAPKSYRYWKITISGTTNDGFFEVGYLMMGALVNPGFTFRREWKISTEYHTSSVVTEFGVVHSEPMYQCINLNLEVGPISSTQMSYIRQLNADVVHDVYPFLLILELNGQDAYMGRFTNQIEETVVLNTIYRACSIQFREDSYGRSLGA